jgi:ubiquinone/menaquinone biosynthesis C-methylase UbiE
MTLMPKEKALKCLDVGCGTGRGVSFLTQQGYDIVGLDYTMNMLKVCQGKLDCAESAKLVQGDAGILPFPDNCFDCIISLNFLHLFSSENQKKFIDEMARVLKPGGTLICEFDNYYRGIIAGKQTLKENPTLHLNYYTDFKYLYSNPLLKIQRICGDALPYVWRIFQYMPTAGAYVNLLSYILPFSLIAPRFFVKATKC